MGHRACTTKSLWDWLALNRALHDTPTTLLWLWQRRKLTRSGLDIFRLRDRLRERRRAFHQLAVSVRAVNGIVRHHWLGLSYCAALLGNLNCAAGHQSDASRSGGELCSSHFERHSCETLLPVLASSADHPHFHQFQTCHDSPWLSSTMRLTMIEGSQGPESPEIAPFSVCLSRYDTDYRARVRRPVSLISCTRGSTFGVAVKQA